MKLLDIQLTDLKETKFTLSSLIQPKKLNLVLFYNTHCLGCTGRAIPLAYELEKSHLFINLIVIHSNFRKSKFTKEEILSVFTNQESPLEIYREDFHQLYDFFDCEGTPHWIFIDENHTILHSFFGSQDGSQMRLKYAIEEFQSKFS